MQERRKGGWWGARRWVPRPVSVHKMHLIYLAAVGYLSGCIWETQGVHRLPWGEVAEMVHDIEVGGRFSGGRRIYQGEKTVDFGNSWCSSYRGSLIPG